MRTAVAGRLLSIAGIPRADSGNGITRITSDPTVCPPAGIVVFIVSMSEFSCVAFVCDNPSE